MLITLPLLILIKSSECLKITANSKTTATALHNYDNHHNQTILFKNQTNSHKIHKNLSNFQSCPLNSNSNGNQYQDFYYDEYDDHYFQAESVEAEDDTSYECVSISQKTVVKKFKCLIQQRKYGGVLNIVGFYYMFLALAIVCNEYLLEEFFEVFKMADSVVGAAFMVAGVPAFELFISFAFAFAKSNVGINCTIVESNVIFILSNLVACAFIVRTIEESEDNLTVLDMSWFPLARDCIFYILPLVVSMHAFSKDQVEWWEALLMISVYAAYVNFLIFNAVTGKEIDFSTRTDLTQTTQYDGASQNDVFIANAIQRLMLYIKNKKRIIRADSDKLEAFENSPLSIDLPNSEDCILKFFWKIFTLPLTICIKFTIPDVRFKSFQEACGGKYILIFNFIMSIVWTSVFSWLMFWWATKIGETLNIEQALMGLTILAAGTSVPDSLISIIAARQGIGDMYVSSSIGSNVFDVTIGLPFAWILYMLFKGKIWAYERGHTVISYLQSLQNQVQRSFCASNIHYVSEIFKYQFKYIVPD